MIVNEMLNDCTITIYSYTAFQLTTSPPASLLPLSGSQVSPEVIIVIVLLAIVIPATLTVIILTTVACYYIRNGKLSGKSRKRLE